VPQVPGIVIFSRQTQRAFANVTIEKKQNCCFLCFPFAVLLWGVRSLALARPAVCAALKGEAVVRGAGSGCCLQLSLRFAFAPFVLYTENCHKYTRTHKRAHVCVYIQNTYIYIHTFASLCTYF